jgi:hypothetical protein
MRASRSEKLLGQAAGTAEVTRAQYHGEVRNDQRHQPVIAAAPKCRATLYHDGHSGQETRKNHIEVFIGIWLITCRGMVVFGRHHLGLADKTVISQVNQQAEQTHYNQQPFHPDTRQGVGSAPPLAVT